MRLKKQIPIVLICMAFLSFASCKKKEVYGCTYPTSVNYSTKATIDDGSCIENKNKQRIYQQILSVEFFSVPNTLKPTFISTNYENGDRIICEFKVSNGLDSNFWTTFPVLTGSGGVKLEAFVRPSGDITFYKDNNYLGSNSSLNSFLSTIRVTLIKKE